MYLMVFIFIQFFIEHVYFLDVQLYNSDPHMPTWTKEHVLIVLQ